MFFFLLLIITIIIGYLTNFNVAMAFASFVLFAFIKEPKHWKILMFFAFIIFLLTAIGYDVNIIVGDALNKL